MADRFTFRPSAGATGASGSHRCHCRLGSGKWHRSAPISASRQIILMSLTDIKLIVPINATTFATKYCSGSSSYLAYASANWLDVCASEVRPSLR